MTESGIEGLLRTAAAGVRYPAAPDVAARLPHLLSRRAAAAPVRRLQPAWAAALLLALVAALATALAVGPSRDAIARLFGVEGSRIEVLPTPLPGATVTAMPASAEEPLPGAPVPLSEVAAMAGFEVPLPAVEESLLQAYVVTYGADRVVVLEYESFVLWVAHLDQFGTFGKGVGPDSIFVEVRVGEHAGVWLAGEPHLVYYVDSAGTRLEQSRRVVHDNTLIWRTDEAFYRIETPRTFAEALRIAETLP